VNDTEENLRHEVQELRAEVSRLRNILNCLGLAALAIIVLAAPTAVAVLAAMVVFALLASPVRINGEIQRPSRPAPRAGQDTLHVLGEVLGYTQARIDGLTG